jgi:hypothetical protein
MNIHFIAECDEIPADVFSLAGLIICEIAKYPSVNGVFKPAFFFILFIEKIMNNAVKAWSISLGVGSEAERAMPFWVTVHYPGESNCGQKVRNSRAIFL